MTYVGQGVPSLTNNELVAGKGTFVDDIPLPGMTYMARPAQPATRTRGSARSTRRAAEALPGVLCVVTGQRDRARTRTRFPET